MRLHELWASAARLVDEHDQRWGQAVFNSIPADTPGLTEIAGTLDDPFYRIKTKIAVRRWVERHLVVDCVGTILEVRVP